MANNNKILQTLTKAGLVKSPIPDVDGELESPWYVKVILAFSGWAAALFFLGFFGMLFSFHNTTLGIFVGGGMLIGSYFLLETTKGNVFVEHTALAMSLVGQVLIAWSFSKILKFDGPVFWFTLAAFQAVLSIVMPSFIHALMSSLFAALALSIGLTSVGVPFLAVSILMAIVVLIWLYEFDHLQYIKRKSAIGYGLVLALIAIKGGFLFGLDFSQLHKNESAMVMHWVGEILSGVVVLYLVWKLLERLGYQPTSPVSIAALGGALLLSLASMEAQGVTVGLVVLLLGFANSNKVLMGLGVTSLLFYISSYYYLLNNTLMEKSQTMLIVGLLLLAIRWVIKRFLNDDKGVQHG